MTTTADPRLVSRVLRTLRVATATALAEYELTAGRAAGQAPVVFRALAAKSADGWRFPDAGIVSADGLIGATLLRDAAGAPATLVLQALGSAGLDAYAGRGLTLSFGAFGPEVTVLVSAGGRAEAAIADLAIDEDDLAAFDLTLVDGTP